MAIFVKQNTEFPSVGDFIPLDVHIGSNDVKVGMFLGPSDRFGQGLPQASEDWSPEPPAAPPTPFTPCWDVPPGTTSPTAGAASVALASWWCEGGANASVWCFWWGFGVCSGLKPGKLGKFQVF